MNVWIIVLIVAILNLPFGYWRANVRKMTLQWFVAIHVPVVIAGLLRVVSGIGWDFVTFPALVAAFSAGQFLGGRWHRWWRTNARASFTSCLVWDLLRELGATARS